MLPQVSQGALARRIAEGDDAEKRAGSVATERTPGLGLSVPGVSAVPPLQGLVHVLPLTQGFGSRSRGILHPGLFCRALTGRMERRGMQGTV
jgi:hypothetical protein